MRITLSRILGAAFLLYAADGSQYEGPLNGIVRTIGIALLLSSRSVYHDAPLRARQ